jgi:hypothetical protein
MYGKLFAGMFHGSLRKDWRALVTMQQLVILCDRDGVVDMSTEALAATTGIPFEIIAAGIQVLEAPDTESRSPAEGGRRILRLDDHRSWGWRLVNHEHYRNLLSESDRREKAAERQRRHRQGITSSVTLGHASSRLSRHADTDADADTEDPKEGARAQALAGAWPHVILIGEGVPKGRLELAPCNAREELELDDFGPRIRLKSGHEAAISKEQLELYRRTYERVDVDAELRAMAQWSIDNPKKRKTEAGVLAFVNRWLKGEERDSKGKAASRARESSEAAYLEQLGGANGR